MTVNKDGKQSLDSFIPSPLPEAKILQLSNIEAGAIIEFDTDRAARISLGLRRFHHTATQKYFRAHVLLLFT